MKRSTFASAVTSASIVAIVLAMSGAAGVQFSRSDDGCVGAAKAPEGGAVQQASVSRQNSGRRAACSTAAHGRTASALQSLVALASRLALVSHALDLGQTSQMPYTALTSPAPMLLSNRFVSPKSIKLSKRAKLYFSLLRTASGGALADRAGPSRASDQLFNAGSQQIFRLRFF